MTDAFYDNLAPVARFDALVQAEAFQPVPDRWYVAVADIANSTAAIAEGRYKTVNMVGAAVISAVRNALPGTAFPAVFGGDGATLAVPPQGEAATRAALQAVQAWARDLFGLDLRAAILPVSELRAAGHDLRVARYAVNAALDYAMFSGGGMAWAEAELKAGRIHLEPAGHGVMPDLTGLSCRWANLKARHGQIVSVLILPETAGSAAFDAVCGEVLRLTETVERGGHPAPAAGPGLGWPTGSAALNRAASGKGPLGVFFETALAWVVMRSRIKLGGFDPAAYAAETSGNADFRKFDDGLKMTLDLDAATLDALTALLDRAAAEGTVRYGIQTQDEAMMTCIVPSALQSDHMHFVDGAAGGYTQAAAQLKGRG